MTEQKGPEITTGLASQGGRRCNNGGCTRPAYRGTECFSCWAGTKWDSMKQRVEDRRGHYPQWRGLPLKLTRREFVEWATLNPPPLDMAQPSIDRIDPSLGYEKGNIRWLESRLNSRNRQHDVALTMRRCPVCMEVKELSPDNFHRNRSDAFGFANYCKPCFRRLYA